MAKISTTFKRTFEYDPSIVNELPFSIEELVQSGSWNSTGSGVKLLDEHLTVENEEDGQAVSEEDPK